MTVVSVGRPDGVLRAAGLAGLLALTLASLFVGVGALSPKTLFSDPEALRLMMVSRLPRTLAALLAGSALAIAGLVMQTLARNRFVEPATAGTAQSAALGILLVTVLWPEAPLGWKAAVASLAALAGTSVFLALVHKLPPTQPFLVPLFGIVYGSVVGAAATFAAWRLDLLQYLEIWTTGEFSGILRGRYELLWIAGALVALAWWTADRLTILSLGRDVGVGLGLNYAAVLRLGLVIVSAVTALTVVVVGIIPFVGLVAPNLISRFAGENLRHTLPWVAGTGAALVLSCDIIGRLIRFPYEIPVGTVLGVVGAALFLALLFVRRADG
ncbi:iron chelate uptake ABC transporter family permease subunit [Mesorhizobium sp. LHD-90]|uniref:ABC transporter permease n=1 Tax=Mesorhizobium sp. LHD-90 TaxID=3071414 RepID=UPI0027E070F4|nr:iron chelate uptake ABC transporter family permease subunit [Mesorhizobium sp. LHD-90]MDQ6433880.1 iron chelate uptake ABC transporter family permease subunit [Mesorhizobium sp. LHD-90]